MKLWSVVGGRRSELQSLRGQSYRSPEIRASEDEGPLALRSRRKVCIIQIQQTDRPHLTLKVGSWILISGCRLASPDLPKKARQIVRLGRDDGLRDKPFGSLSIYIKGNRPKRISRLPGREFLFGVGSSFFWKNRSSFLENRTIIGHTQDK
jgi:hypothetical protein